MRKVAVLTLGVGSGHVRAAEVIEQALGDGRGDAEGRVLDALELATPWFRRLYVDSYWLMLRHAGFLWRALFERRHRRRHRATAPRWVFRHGCARVFEHLKALAPDLVIANEIGAVEIAALAKREGWFQAPILAVQTDFHTEPPWVQPEIDFWCVGSDEARSQLIGWGVSPHRIVVTGVPIDPSFALEFDKAEVQRSVGLTPGNPTVLVMGGGMGPAPLDEVVRSLEACRLPLQVVVAAGRDRRMLRKLEKLRRRGPAMELRVMGWTDRVPELMAAADLLITKPGGVSISEALASGIPLLVAHPIPGPEERHVRYLVERGVALYAPSTREIPELAFGLLSRPDRRIEMSRRARQLARPDAAHAVAQVALALMEKATYIDLVATPPARPGDSAYVM
jgi:processive 1,2-diacylglycerol beta-glucosyltransferase